ncbi:hypothetical protein JSQ73_002820 [Wolbachia endosymbiont of Anopheles demeilloni]|uniref:hypothetical protein n=1 Tax=Wolbachia endosymbiont of Anopheles demeilloni TaxID=2748871 RepID=UPI001F18635D|nr:hypothetical protein [Wolbachia endosymbiont of Anopheles demeilloni]UIP93378.1 hypothetical protein JSQ73_002820 [Wolbachia endosymbiont of Anopheles demeilloni]
MGSLYPSDISRGKFEIIVADLKSCRKRTKPRQTFLDSKQIAFQKNISNIKQKTDISFNHLNSSVS